MSFVLSIFRHRTYILYHFAFLVCLQARIFSTPKYTLLAPKTYFLMAILLFWAMCLLVKTACVYTIAVHFYA